MRSDKLKPLVACLNSCESDHSDPSEAMDACDDVDVHADQVGSSQIEHQDVSMPPLPLKAMASSQDSYRCRL